MRRAPRSSADDAGYLYTRYARGRLASPDIAIDRGRHASASPARQGHDPGDRHGVRASLARPALPPTRATRPTPARVLREPQTTSTVAGPPAIEAPKNDLSWRDCTSRVFATPPCRPARRHAGLRELRRRPGSDQRRHGHGRVSAWCGQGPAQTPPDAGPLVMTTGSDLPSSSQLPVWLSRAGADVLKTHPIVAVDRRGMGMSGAIECRDMFDRQEMLDQAQFQSGDDPVANLGDISPDRDHQLHRHHRARRLGVRQRTRRRGHRTVAQHLGRAHDRAARCRQRRPGRACLRRIAPQQGGAAGARLPAAARHRRRGRDGAAHQGRTGLAGCVGRAVHRHQLPTGARPEGGDRLPAGIRAGRPRTWRRLGGDGHRRHHHCAGVSPRRPGQRR